MSRNLCIIPECYIDSSLVEIILDAGKNHVNHQKGNGTVARTMENKFADGFCIGVLDEDRKPLSYLQDFEVKKQNDFLKLFKHKSRHHYVVQIRPAVERWLLNICEKYEIELDEFELPTEFEALKKESKSITSKHDNRFLGLFKKLVEKDVEPVKILKKWLIYLNDKRFQANVESDLNG